MFGVKSLIYDNVNFLFTVTTIFNFFVICWLFRKYSKFFLFSILIYYTLFLDNVSVMRNSISLSFFYLSIPYLVKRKAIPYFILNLIGVGFHTSSLVFFPLYYVVNRVFSKKVYWSFFIICNIIFLFHLNPFKDLIELTHYLPGERASRVLSDYIGNSIYYNYGFLSIGYIERVATGILMLCFYDRLIKSEKHIPHFYNLFFLFIGTRFLLAEFDVLPVRFGILFLISYCILLPQVYIYLRPQEKMLLLFLFFIYSICRIIGLTAGDYENYLYDNILF